ncbi:MAG: acetate--CoA ligase family protein [Pseudomonadota bacterium]
MPDLSRLLRPKSIAVIGGGWGVAVIEQCLKMGFPGEIWPVHPKRDEIHGLPCIARIEDLPEAPDATFIGINRHLTIEAVSALSSIGAGGATCFASGFAEAEDDRAAGSDLQAQLIAAAGDMPVLGPNCYGFINYLDGVLLWPDQHGGKQVESGVAILAQSSNILINLTMQRRALPMAYCLTAGNQAQIGLEDLAMAALEDERVTALGMHIEGIRDLRKFEAMATRARELRKPVVALKVGRSEQAQAATISHTASLAGGDAASRAFLKRLGIVQVDGLAQFLETLKLLHVQGPMLGRKIVSLSCSGGEASLIADLALSHDVDLPSLAPEQRNAVKATLSDLVTVTNPIDYHTFIWNDVPRMTATYAAMMRGPQDATMLIVDFPREDRTDAGNWRCAEQAVTAAADATGARTIVATSLPENLTEERAERLMQHSVAPMMGLEECLSSVASAADLGEAWRNAPPAPVTCSPPRADDLRTLTEFEAKNLLAGYGLRIPLNAVASTAAEAGAIAGRWGNSVVLKGQGFAHKTEAGAVRLSLRGAAEVEAAARNMRGATGFLVEEMITDMVAELIVGVVRDPVYGFALTIGAGGILTELLSDSATLLVPAPRREVRAAVESLRVHKLLAGYRGKPAADLNAVLDAVEGIQRFVTDHANELEELDVNPLMVTPGSAVVADALIRM